MLIAQTAHWATDPWIWVGWAVFLGASITAVVAIIVLVVLTGPRHE